MTFADAVGVELEIDPIAGADFKGQLLDHAGFAGQAIDRDPLDFTQRIKHAVLLLGIFATLFLTGRPIYGRMRGRAREKAERAERD